MKQELFGKQKRLLAFNRKIKKTREQVAKEIFDKPLKNNPLDEGDLLNL